MKSYWRFVMLLFVCIVFTGCGVLDNMVGSVVPIEDGSDGKNGSDGTNGSNGIDGSDGTNGSNGMDGTSSVVKLIAVSMPDCDTVTITVEKIGPNSRYIVTVDVYGAPVLGQAPYLSYNIEVDVAVATVILKANGNPPFYVVIDGTDGLYATCN